MPPLCLLPIKDSCINEIDPDTNYGDNIAVYLGATVVDTEKTALYRAIVTFQLPTTLTTAQVNKAYLLLGNGDSDGALTVYIRRITQAWTEGGVTYNDYDGVNAWPGGAGGLGDTDTPQLTRTTPANDFAMGWWTVEVADMVTDAITSRGGLVDIMIKLADEEPGETKMYGWVSKENVGEGGGLGWFRPRLLIVSPPFGVPQGW